MQLITCFTDICKGGGVANLAAAFQNPSQLPHLLFSYGGIGLPFLVGHLALAFSLTCIRDLKY